MRCLIYAIPALFALATSAVQAVEALAPAAVPEPLKPWIEWALHDQPEHACPQLGAGGARHCAWYGPLVLRLDDGGGTFELEVRLAGPGRVALPGGEGQWPQQVTQFDTAVTVVTHGGRPAVRLPAGRHVLAGRFEWPALPDLLELPAELPLLALYVRGAARDGVLPPLDGKLWLAPPPAVASAADERLDIEVFRRLDDDQPFMLETVIELDVAGNEREQSLTGGMLEGGIPLRLESPLPARLEADGSLRFIARPGRWQLRLVSRYPAPISALVLPALPAPWPAEEVWSFAAHGALRVVEVSGARPVDPRQTRLPADWHALPAWRIASGEGLKFAEQRRGDPEPEPDSLALHRELWLDFDGGGYTASDRLSGRMTRGWRLEAAPAVALGRVLLNGEAQFITSVAGGAAGVEVRRGVIDLRAESRYTQSRTRVPAVGWTTGVQQLSATLNLPPGWRLWSAGGVDNVPDTWLNRWTLLDLFLVLIVAVAAARLLGRRAAVLALLTLVLLWHEPGAPRQVWLHLLGALALLSVLPAGGRLRAIVTAYRNASLVVLLAFSVGFMIEAVRTGLYPQLAQPYHVVGSETMAAGDLRSKTMAAAAPQMMEAMSGAASRAADASMAEADTVERELRGAPARQASAQAKAYDPAARVQTGPGLPDWHWTTIDLGWSGPVTADQTLSLYLLSPVMNLVLTVLRVVLLAALALCFLAEAGGRWPRRPAAAPSPQPAVSAAVAWLLITVCCAALLAPRPLAATELPDPALLDELARRLTLAPSCAPECATIARLAAVLGQEQLSLRLEVHVADARVALPVPGGNGQWLAQRVLIDGAPATALVRDAGGGMWLALPAGKHDVVLAGTVPAGSSFQVPFPLVPRQLSVVADGWRASGVRPDGGSEGQLIFTRLAPGAAADAATLEARPLPPLFRIERTLRLALDWRVETRVIRLSPADSAAELSIPLLDGEAVTTPDMRVEDGAIKLSFASADTERAWASVLARSDTITLTAPADPHWVETWHADISPLWHATLAGLAVVHHQDAAGQWLPTWQPWPGEQVSIALVRPEGVAGPVLTVERSHLALRPAARSTAAQLRFSARSSQGGQHTVELPQDVELERVAIDGIAQSIRQDGRAVTLPLVPGTREFELVWRSAAGVEALYRTPDFTLGVPSVNARLEVGLPEDRWTLFTGGPRLGPAVLFWGVLIVIAAVAYGLGRTGYTPLSGWQWLLLGIGLSQIGVVQALVVVGWLFALAWRGRTAPAASAFRFNLLQCVLVVLTVAALGLMFEAIRHGLLGPPDMQIAGNGSSATQLNWFQDRVGEQHPQAWVASVSLWWYRGLMLAWALWLALALLGWLRFGWQCFSQSGLWRALPRRALPPRQDTPPTA